MPHPCPFYEWSKSIPKIIKVHFTKYVAPFSGEAFPLSFTPQLHGYELVSITKKVTRFLS